MWNREPVGGPFSLVDHEGRRRTEADFRGKLLLVYFGYTSCPDICPTDLMEIARALTLLGAESEAVQPLFITLDPERGHGRASRRIHPELLAPARGPDGRTGGDPSGCRCLPGVLRNRRGSEW